MRYYGDITKQLQMLYVKRMVKSFKFDFYFETTGWKISKDKARWTSNFKAPINY